MKSPFIKKQVWGWVEIEGQRVSFKDAKLFPGGSRERDWTETGTGTHHNPGIQVADIQELLDNDATTLILSNGEWGYQEVGPDTIYHLEQNKIPYHSLKAPAAVKLNNNLCGKLERVGALIYSTC
tara:strand:- start:337 stop:711 length:375 start_codon:yes stop_codon:yes gene_type:complete